MTAPSSAARDPVREPAIQKLSLLKLAAPTIAGNFLLSVVALAAIKIVSGLGDDAVAAVVAADRIYFAIQAIIIGLSMGTTALVANAWGARDYAEADRVTRLSLWTGIGTSIVVIVIIEVVAGQLMRVFALEPAIHEMAVDYLRILVYFNLCFAYLAIVSAAIRAAGDALTPVCIGAVGNILNVFLAYGLVYGRFGLPELGVLGAAYALGFSLLAVCIIFQLLWFHRKLILKPYRQSFYDRTRFRHLVQISVPSGIEQLIFNAALVGFMMVISLYGTAPFTAYGIGVNILSLSMVIGFGFAIATSTIVGQYLGAGQPDAAQKAAWHSVRSAFLVMVIIALVLGLSARTVGNFLINDPETVSYLVALVLILASVQPLMAVEFALSGALRGSGDTRSPARITATGFLFGRVLFTMLFWLLDFSVYWIYGALIADYVIKCGLYVVTFKRGKWKTVFAESRAKAAGKAPPAVAT